MRQFYDIDWSELLDVANEFNATEKQVVYALSRAMKRTMTAIRRMSSKYLTKELALRSAAALRKRMKMKVRSNMNSTSRNRSGSDIELWYGLNDLPVSHFKGTPRNNSNGAEFRGTQFEGAFVAKSKIKKRRTIFKRVGKERLPIEEQSLPIADKAITYIDDEIFDEVLLDLFWSHFERDLRARVKFQIGAR
ncbi:hypothetical protein ACK39D_05275 [Aeromonas veronii]|uniref:hypothetical protein n=1 Tax=Aeromonas veronii TaxID=654 RepID=UPI001118383C|nr:hypothetical protein [Aeromonas veronii]TNI81208.1 hypothetical protein CF116_09495 [Aeromonas veronii]